MLVRNYHMRAQEGGDSSEHEAPHLGLGVHVKVNLVECPQRLGSVMQSWIYHTANIDPRLRR